jgi:hypothetical protein
MPPRKVARTYLYTLRNPGLFAELYFPKRVLYQSEIIDALKEGVDDAIVKEYLSTNANNLVAELVAYPYVLDPKRYAGRRSQEISVADIQRRIEIYKNPFFGWSTYSVEGAFLNTKLNELQDELTQVVRVIFRFESELEVAKEKEHHVKGNYAAIATEILKWFDDCALFTFGYLTRRFWSQVSKVGRTEDEIWVTSFFNLGIN